MTDDKGKGRAKTTGGGSCSQSTFPHHFKTTAVPEAETINIELPTTS